MANLPKLPGIPSILPVKDQTIAAILRPMKESIELLGSTVSGTPLAGGQIITGGTNPGLGFPSGSGDYDPTTDYTPPPAPTGFTVTGAYSNIILDWDLPTYRNHAYAEIWRSTTNVLANAVLLGFAPGAVYVDPVGNSQTYYYWIRYVSQANVAGPYNAVVGTQGQTALDPGYLLQVLTGAITETQLFSSLGARINLIDGPSTTPGTVNARIKTETDARTTADSALATSISTLSSTVTTNNTTLTAAIETEATTRANADGTLFAQYTVKVDVNGYVSGFGLASTTTGATPTSDFIIRADRFSIASPSGPGIAPIIPFVVNTTTQTINGVSVPPGVYMDAAYIKNGTITTAKIGTAAIDSAKIADAAIGTAKIADAAITTAKIGDAQITNAKIGAAAISTAQIQDAAITNAKIGVAQITAANIADGQITNAKIGDAQITAAKIIDGQITNAKIQDGAITNAKIANAQIDAAKIADAQITNAKIANGAIDNAKIGDAQITTAKIGTAQIDTLRIAGNNVTVSTSVASNAQYSSMYLNALYGGVINIVAFVEGGWSWNGLTVYVNGGEVLYMVGADYFDGLSQSNYKGSITAVTVVGVGGGNHHVQVYSSGRSIYGGPQYRVMALLTQR